MRDTRRCRGKEDRRKKAGVVSADHREQGITSARIERLGFRLCVTGSRHLPSSVNDPKQAYGATRLTVSYSALTDAGDFIKWLSVVLAGKSAFSFFEQSLLVVSHWATEVRVGLRQHQLFRDLGSAKQFAHSHVAAMHYQQLPQPIRLAAVRRQSFVVL